MPTFFTAALGWLVILFTVFSPAASSAPQTHSLARRAVNGLPAFPEDGKLYFGAVGVST